MGARPGPPAWASPPLSEPFQRGVGRHGGSERLLVFLPNIHMLTLMEACVSVCVPCKHTHGQVLSPAGHKLVTGC